MNQETTSAKAGRGLGAAPCSAVSWNIETLFAWYDLWVGIFWDSRKRKLYILPVPCIGVVIWKCRHEWAHKRNIYGDEILAANARSVWVCSKCGKFQWRNELYAPNAKLRRIEERAEDLPPSFLDNCDPEPLRKAIEAHLA